MVNVKRVVKLNHYTLTTFILGSVFCLCAGCHLFSNKFSAHLTSPEFTFWAIERRGQEWFDKLLIRKNTHRKFIDADYDLIYASIWGV